MLRIFQPCFPLLLGLCLLASACAVRQGSGTELQVHNSKGALVFSAPLPPGAEFGIRFTHSVALSPVEEWFVQRQGQVQLTRTVYADFGAGLPFEVQPGQRMTFEGGKVVLTGFDLTLPRLEVRVGRVAGHELLLPGSKNGGKIAVYPLISWARAGDVLIFSLLQK